MKLSKIPDKVTTLLKKDAVKSCINHPAFSFLWGNQVALQENTCLRKKYSIASKIQNAFIFWTHLSASSSRQQNSISIYLIIYV